MNKRGLVLSGGGSLGAYEVGVLQGLYNTGHKYDVIAGVSVGSLHALSLSQWGSNLQGSGLEDLNTIWKSIETKDVYKKHSWWIFNYISSFWKKSLYTMKPLAQLVEKNLHIDNLHSSSVKGYVGVTNLQDGKYYTLELNSLRKQEVIDVIHASCVFPGMFEPVKLSGIPGLPHGDYVDGGVRDTIPLKVITDLAHKENITEIDIVMTAPLSGGVKRQENFKSAIDVGLRAAFIMADEVMVTDRLQGLCNTIPNIPVRVFAPEKPLNVDGFKFEKDTSKDLIAKGRDDTYAKLRRKSVPTFHSH